MPNAGDSTRRFSSRAPYYHQSRPRYPGAVLGLLAEHIGLTRQSVIADIGAGTGISSELFLNYGCTVYAVEPNADMRAIAAEHYDDRPNLTLVDGTAEATTLPNHSVDFITAGQAFHWFDPVKAHAEFTRILKPDGWVVLFWNTRPDTMSPFLTAYNDLVRSFDIEAGSTLRQTEKTRLMAREGFFAEENMTKHVLPNPQTCDFDGLIARTLSASYMPLPGMPRYEEMLAALRDLFEQHQQNGLVTFDYVTEVFWRRGEEA